MSNIRVSPGLLTDDRMVELAKRLSKSRYWPMTNEGYKPHRNLRTMVKNECGTAIDSQFDCAFDAVARRSSVVNSGQAFAADAFNLYGYNDRNELRLTERVQNRL